MVWYLNMNKSTYSHWSKHVWGDFGASNAFYFIFCQLYVIFRRDSTLMFIYHRHIFVWYIIHQNSPLSKSLRCIIPWFLRNRSYRRRAPRYRRHAPSYRRHPIKLPSSVISVKFAYCRLAANLSRISVQKREKIRAGKNFSKRAAASAPSWRR